MTFPMTGITPEKLASLIKERRRQRLVAKIMEEELPHHWLDILILDYRDDLDGY